LAILVRKVWVFLSVLLAAGLGCGAQELSSPVLSPTPLQETTFVQDQVVVNFRVETIEGFGTKEFRFNGSLRNLGASLENARFEVYTTNNISDSNGNRRRQIVASQEYGQLLSNQVQNIAVSAVVPSVSNVSITGVFAHD